MAVTSERLGAGGHEVPVVLLRPAAGWSLGLGELWARRELVYFFAWRDLKVRYKQTALGALWALLQPLVTMLVFSVFFGRLAKVPSSGLPYPVFTLAALVPWGFVSNGVTQAATSLVTNAALLRKIYFPRLAAPIASVGACVVDLAIAFALYVFVALAYGYPPTLRALWLPLILLIALATALGLGTFLAAVNVEYRDVRYALPFLMQIWLFITPVAYPSTLVHNEPWASLYALNPMVGVVDGFRWAMLSADVPLARTLPVSTAVALLALALGTVYFRRRERFFADVV